MNCSSPRPPTIPDSGPLSGSALSSSTFRAPASIPSQGRLLAPLAHKKIGQLSLGRILRAAGLKMLLVDDPDRKTQPAAIDLDCLLKAAGLKLILIDDHEALAQVAPMYEDRASRAVRLNNDCR